ncbi:GyrI-like domain-containing protein [Bacillus sp. ISL-47]|uniref:AraC family transcriptional regulator n=1 Tax=Bacillus sp. ISL-47 TaxID=2819130 RepID=UPI001BE716DF|nr:GyrI-like domain-containing protein [Bacillus sp. ISL-47]MBT2689428.1 GyrI-like domain-containing protein [Bacillus sp. ISL-47]MBT2709849.1 GyrI-like domain-containing protein [Pseudomonas sp. ISL-84]
MKIIVTTLPETEVGYIRRTGSYFEPQEHWGNLISWASSNGLFPPEQSFIGISLDNPELLERRDCRHDACVTIPDGFDKEKHKEIKFKKLSGGDYALYPFYDTPDNLNSAYQYMFGEWLPKSEYDPDYDRYNLEYNMNNPAEDTEGKCKVDLYVPVRKKTS